MTKKFIVKSVSNIPDLMNWDDYDDVEIKKRVRVRLSMTENGLEIIVDGPYPQKVEELLSKLDPKIIESMLCG